MKGFIRARYFTPVLESINFRYIFVFSKIAPNLTFSASSNKVRISRYPYTRLAMKRLILVIATLLLFPVLTSAHPDRTASDGCHVCRTNCEKWGVPRERGIVTVGNRSRSLLPGEELRLKVKTRPSMKLKHRVGNTD